MRETIEELINLRVEYEKLLPNKAVFPHICSLINKKIEELEKKVFSDSDSARPKRSGTYNISSLVDRILDEQEERHVKI